MAGRKYVLSAAKDCLDVENERFFSVLRMTSSRTVPIVGVDAYASNSGRDCSQLVITFPENIMALFNLQDLENRTRLKEDRLRKSAETQLREAVKSFDPTKQYNIFLSHRYLDARYILDLKDSIETIGYTVFVDWKAAAGWL